jgi:hypothetical protein
MPNAIVTTAKIAPSPQPLPVSLRQALADPFAFGDHADLPRKLPDKLPPTDDLRRGIGMLQAQLQPVDRNHAMQCLSKLVVGFNERRTADESKLLLEVWLEANGDLPADLWSAGTRELLRAHKFGMPKPVHLREAVEAQFRERNTALRRAQEMLDVANEKPKAQGFVPEPRNIRLRSMRDSFVKVGKVHKAACYERELAGIEGREVEDWARDPQPEPRPADKHDDVTPPSPSPESQARLKIALAKSWRAQGNETRARSLEREAQKLAPHLFEDVLNVPEVA